MTTNLLKSALMVLSTNKYLKSHKIDKNQNLLLSIMSGKTYVHVGTHSYVHPHSLSDSIICSSKIFVQNVSILKKKKKKEKENRKNKM